MCATNTASTPTNTACSTLATQLSTPTSPLVPLDVAGLQDLERFRVITRVPSDNNYRCTLHVTGVMAMNQPDILTQVHL